jgi:enoyl-CoA hydratase/carnithine racemase
VKSEDVIFSEREGLATLTLNRPEKLNTLDTAVFEQLLSHLGQIEAATDTIGCVVLRGSGRSFSAGHDLAVLTVAHEVFRTRGTGPDMHTRIASFSQRKRPNNSSDSRP